MGRYWLVKVPDAAMASAWMPLPATPSPGGAP
jgi:hypothetical protein